MLFGLSRAPASRLQSPELAASRLAPSRVALESRLGGCRAESWTNQTVRSRLALTLSENQTVAGALPDFGAGRAPPAAPHRAFRASSQKVTNSPLTFQMAPPKATKTAAEKKPAKKTTKSPAGDKKKKVKRSKARMGPSPDRLCSCAPSPRPSRARLSDWPLPPLTLCRPRATRSTSTRC